LQAGLLQVELVSLLVLSLAPMPLVFPEPFDVHVLWQGVYAEIFEVRHWPLEEDGMRVEIEAC
jgi:hypothetical protein